jgi:hypothetical protein
MPNTTNPAAKIIGPFEEENMTIRGHLDPDKHFIGDAIAPPSASEIAVTIGTVTDTGVSPFVARADHIHALDPGLRPFFFNIAGSAIAGGTTTSFVDWLTSFQTVPIPSWATSYIVQVNLTNIFVTTAVAGYAFETSLEVNTYAGGGDRGLFQPSAINDKHSISFTGSRTIPSTIAGTSKSIIIGSRRFSGTGVVQWDTLCRGSGIIHFK